MKQDWENFLKQRVVKEAFQPEADTANGITTDWLEQNGYVYCALPSLGCIEINGADATAFLQGQFSNDVRQVTDIQGQISSYCTPKGRLLASFYLLRWQERYWMILPVEILSGVLQRLRMFVLRSKVELIDRSEEYAIFGSLGQLDDKATQSWGTAPAAVFACTSREQALQCRLPGPGNRILILANASYAHAQLQQDPHPIVGESVWHWNDIMAGLPDIRTATQESFTPQMLNLDLIGGVSFSKGCYPGQEVVARTHYLGKIKRRMQLFECTNAEQINIGDEINNEHDETMGKIVSRVRTRDGSYALLAVIPLEQADQALHLATQPNARLKKIELPYSVAPKG